MIDRADCSRRNDMCLLNFHPPCALRNSQLLLKFADNMDGACLQLMSCEPILDVCMVGYNDFAECS